MTPQSEAEGVDFKPFFDLIIGVLFIFLILIVAQMFFTQWVPTRDETRNWEREVSAFLDELADALRQAGLTASVDTASTTIAVPLQEVVVPDADSRPRVSAGPAAAFGRVLYAHLNCVSRARSPRSDCLGHRLDLRHVWAEVRLAAMPSGTELAHDRYAKLVALELAAGVFVATPQLLGLTGTSGTPVIDIASAIAATPGEGGLRGDIALRFTFDPPAGLTTAP